MSDVALHKTTHWRRLRNILNQLIKLENVNASNFNLNKIVCYSTVGSELQGSNVKFHRTNRTFMLGK